MKPVIQKNADDGLIQNFFLQAFIYNTFLYSAVFDDDRSVRKKKKKI